MSSSIPPYGEARSSSSRFLPPDPAVEMPHRLTPGLAFRVGVLGTIALIVFTILTLRLLALQVISGERHLAVAQGNQLRTIKLDAPRGTIVDRNGKVIVDNVAGTAVKLWVGDLPKQGRYAIVQRLAAVLDVPAGALAKEVTERRTDPLNPITVKTGVSEDQVQYLLEHQAELPGVQVQQVFLRNYPLGSRAAQVLGYVGEISPDELKRLRQDGYESGDKIGKAGIESAWDRYLRGTAGLAQITVDSLGHPQSPLVPKREATTGFQVRLTVDVKLQQAAEEALRFGIDTARANKSYYADGGAIVALDPTDGAVLASASYPTYKPSVYVGKIDPKKIAPLVDNATATKKNFPGLNRVTQAQYPPGSIWKPVTALAAMQEHRLSPYELIPCTPTATYGLDQFKFRNWDPYVNKPITLTEALARSCDTYFYEVGFRFYNAGREGRSRMQEWATKFGFGKPTGFGIGAELAGIVPTPAWRKKNFTGWDAAWNPGDSIQLSIGQKEVRVTPLQMAVFYAMIANGGKIVTPYIVQSAETPGANGLPSVVKYRNPIRIPTSAGVDPAALQIVREGLLSATHSAFGTSQGVFASYPISIAGKTGTAEEVVAIPGYPSTHTEDQSWWCGYGPTDSEAKIVVCAIIENGGHGSTAAAPAALKVFEKFFGVKSKQQILVGTD
ncbi:MAG: penicillin-binding protein 2 [Gaiellales bacterium]